MKKNLRLFILLFAFMLQCPIMLANNAEGVEINLTQRTKPKQNGNSKPSRAPARRVVLPVSAFFNETNRSINISCTSGDSVCYYIYDEDGLEVSNGIFPVVVEEGETIYLGGLQEGEYYLVLDVDDVIYEGVFQL